jgi:multicomponent Na+:H+ antiporter subunit B
VSAARRRVLLLPALAVMTGVLVWGMTGLPDFGIYLGRYGRVINAITVPARHTDNAVGTTVFDFRGFDTLGEEFILFTAVMGVVLLLREQRKEEEVAGDSPRSDALRTIGLLMVGPALLIGVWLAAFGYITPGGGFQAGVVIAGAVLLLYLAGGHGLFAKVATEVAMDESESFGLAGYLLVGLAALIAGKAFLTNLFGLGEAGSLNAGGSIPLLNWASAVEVAAANVLLLAEYLATYVVPLLARERAR